MPRSDSSDRSECGRDERSSRRESGYGGYGTGYLAYFNRNDVPASNDTVFLKGFPTSEFRTSEIKHYFEDNVAECSVVFEKITYVRPINDEIVFVALRFESPEDAKKAYDMCSDKKIMGYRIHAEWFKDIRGYIRDKKANGGDVISYYPNRGPSTFRAAFSGEQRSSGNRYNSRRHSRSASRSRSHSRSLTPVERGGRRRRTPVSKERRSRWESRSSSPSRSPIRSSDRRLRSSTPDDSGKRKRKRSSTHRANKKARSNSSSSSNWDSDSGCSSIKEDGEIVDDEGEERKESKDVHREENEKKGESLKSECLVKELLEVAREQKEEKEKNKEGAQIAEASKPERIATPAAFGFAAAERGSEEAEAPTAHRQITQLEGVNAAKKKDEGEEDFEIEIEEGELEEGEKQKKKESADEPIVVDEPSTHILENEEKKREAAPESVPMQASPPIESPPADPSSVHPVSPALPSLELPAKRPPLFPMSKSILTNSARVHSGVLERVFDSQGLGRLSSLAGGSDPSSISAMQQRERNIAQIHGMGAAAVRRFEMKRTTMEEGYARDCETFGIVAGSLLKNIPSIGEELRAALISSLDDLEKKFLTQLDLFIEIMVSV